MEHWVDKEAGDRDSLPLMSYGRSFILFTFLALGIVMNLRMRRFVN